METAIIAFFASVIGAGAIDGGATPQPMPQNHTCEMVQVEGTNYFNFADPTCPAFSAGENPVIVEEVVEEPVDPEGPVDEVSELD